MDGAELSRLLKRGQIWEALDQAQAWLAACTPGEPEELLSHCSPEDRPRLITLMRDVLAGNPLRLAGVPVLLHYSSETGRSLVLPQRAEGENFGFTGWAGLNARLPLREPFRLATVPANRIVAAVALFEVAEDRPVVGKKLAGLPGAWWAELFGHAASGGHLRLDGGRALPHPDALEAARILHTGVPLRPGPFLSNPMRTECLELAVAFRGHGQG